MRQRGKIKLSSYLVVSYLAVPALALVICGSTTALAQTPTATITAKPKPKARPKPKFVEAVPAAAATTACLYGRNADLTCVSPKQHAAVVSTQTLNLIAASVGTNQNGSAYTTATASFGGYPSFAQQNPFSYVSPIGINSGYKAFSDIRLKHDVTPIAILADGVTLYSFRYFWSDQVYVGVMAQQVAAIAPDAVATEPNGYLSVDYGQLGLKMQTWEQWQASQKSRESNQ